MTYTKALSLAAILTLSFSLNAQPRIMTAVGAVQKQADNSQSQHVIVSEDFSKFAAGSESEPDSKNIADLRTGVIDAQYTAAPGWSGAAIYQAGGACAIMTGMYSGDNGPYEDTGFLRTPLGDYAGNLAVTFRARLLSDDATSDVMAVILNSTVGRLEAATVTVTPEWQDFSVDFSKGLFSGCLVEMSMLKEKVLIDDLTVTSVQTSIPAPIATAATDFTDNGFTANWLPTDEAESYLLTVYERDVEKASSLVDFEGLNLTEDGKHIVSDDSGLPEDWTFAYGNGVSRHVQTGAFGGSTGIVFAGTGDGFMTPDYKRPIRDFSFYAAHPSGVECFSQVRFSCLVGSDWVAIGNIDIERIAKDGEIINLSSKLPEGTTQIQMYFNKNTANDAGKDISIVIDNIKVMVEPDATVFIADREVSGTSAVVDGLDADTDYSYTVKAVNASFSSEESNNVMAAGLASPVLLSPENVTDNAYTARWKPSPKADGYFATNYRVFTAPADQEVTILYENFDKVTRGTLTSPVGLYNTYNPTSLDQYTITPGWLGLSTYLVNGMLGTRSFFTAQGCIQTPALDLSADEGRFKVKMMIVGDTDAVGDSLVVQAGPRIFKRQLISAHTEPIELTFDFDCGETAMPLLIYSYGGKPFYIDEMTVSQNFKKGQQTFTEVETKTVDGQMADRADFDGLSAAENESFAFRVFAFRDFYGGRLYSLSDAAMHVTSTAGITDANADDAGVTVSVDGRELTVTAANPCHLTIYGVNGMKVADCDIDSVKTLNLPSSGLYLVTTDTGFTAKLIIK